MPRIPSLVHGILDYSVGAALLFAPRILGFRDGRVPRAFGAGAIAYSLFTRYELGVVKTIPFRTHLKLDMASGAMMGALGLTTSNWLPYVLVGLTEIAVPALSEPEARSNELAVAH